MNGEMKEEISQRTRLPLSLASAARRLNNIAVGGLAGVNRGRSGVGVTITWR